MGTLLIHASLFLLLGVNMHHLRNLFPLHKFNEVIEFIKFQDLGGGNGNDLPQFPPEQESILEKIETAEILPVNKVLPEDFTAEVAVSDELKTDSINVLDVSEGAGLGGYGNGMMGISNYKLPTFLGQDYNYFHIWFREQFKFPAEMKGHYIQKVLVVFMVDSEGNVTKVGVRDCPIDLLTQEINRIMRLSPKWIPAKRGERNTNFYFQLPVNIN